MAAILSSNHKVLLIEHLEALQKVQVRQFEANDLHNDYAAADSIIRAQEAYLEFIWSHKESLSINLLHIGDKKYSNLSIKSFIGKNILEGKILN